MLNSDQAAATAPRSGNKSRKWNLSLTLATGTGPTLPASESFRTVVPAAYDQVVRGVSVTPEHGR